MQIPFIPALALLCMQGAAFAAEPASQFRQPHPSLTPQQVVQVQLDALKSVDQPAKDAGFATVFGFASPENRAQTGPLPRFSKMIQSGFGEMLNHKSARLQATVQQQDEALQPVEITSVGGKVYRYVFVLRRQHLEDCRGCWYTDGVIPQDPAERSQEL